MDAVVLEVRAKVLRPEGPSDRCVLGRHPRLGRVLWIPEMNVRVNDHSSIRQPDSDASAASVQARPYGNSYRASDSGSISML